MSITIWYEDLIDSLNGSVDALARLRNPGEATETIAEAKARLRPIFEDVHERLKDAAKANIAGLDRACREYGLGPLDTTPIDDALMLGWLAAASTRGERRRDAAVRPTGSGRATGCVARPAGQSAAYRRPDPGARTRGAGQAEACEEARRLMTVFLVRLASLFILPLAAALASRMG
jgi:hypothetical protein